jgi:hypothetical protein
MVTARTEARADALNRALRRAPAARRALLAVAALLATAAPALAQNGTPERVRVFLDCQTRGCDRQEFRTEITFVDWVRERTVADVHLIFTSQSAGGGTQYVFDFVGLDAFEGSDLRLEATVSDTDTRDEVLAALVRTFKGGLVPYVARRGYLHELEISALRQAPVGEDALEEVDDPWHLWVFSVSADIEADGEEQQSSYEISGRLSANRTTPDWKINIGLDGTHEYERYELTGGTETFDTDEWEFDVLVVRSLTPHWSTGTMLEVNTSTSLNRALGGRAAAALEWNYYPYEQANRRQFIVHYQVGFSRVRYEEITVYDRTLESLYDHRLVAVYDTRQPWGNVSVSAEGSNLLHDFSKYRLATRARTNFRLFRGFDLRIQGNFQVIRDQVYLAAGGLSDEERLVQRRELETGYEYSVELGFNYRFGSIYNNVVNNRFPWSVLR